MQPETKKLGELLVEAGLMTPGQLQEALRYQRFNGGRMGSNLVTLGFISEDVLMDFLAQKTGVPRLELKGLEIPPVVLKKIPRRLADQFTILPVSFKEPKGLVLAMADPMDLNAVDSARFASGLQIEPMVASHTALRQAIAEHYLKLDMITKSVVEVGNIDEGLPVNFNVSSATMDVYSVSTASAENKAITHKDYAKDPFFDNNAPTSETQNPFGFFSEEYTEPVDPLAAATTRPVPEEPMVIHARATQEGPRLRRLESLPNRALILGLIRLLQRRGIVGDDELQRFINNLIDSGELKETDGFSSGPGSSVI